MVATDDETLHTVTMRSRAAATGADSKEEASLFIELTMLLVSLADVVGDRRQRCR